jgi:hypothetical protein
VTALRESYNDGCRWKHFRWSLVLDMENIVQMMHCGLLYLSGVVGWEFWWIGRERQSQ